MKTHKLSPTIGWDKFTDNINVSEYIFSELMPLANSGELEYTNFMVGLGDFSGEAGFCSMEFFLPTNDDEIEILIDLNIGVNSTKGSNTFELLSENLRNKFGLVECL